MNTSACIHTCNGLLVTSYDKSVVNCKFQELMTKEMMSYKKYKRWYKFSSDATAGESLRIVNLLITKDCLDYEYDNRLRFVRIYFDTPSFDRITKDRAAKFTDMLSAIGGTMGLLTGFSIISGVEIFYFALKIAMRVCFINRINVY